jgi:hypothetical protein
VGALPEGLDDQGGEDLEDYEDYEDFKTSNKFSNILQFNFS